MYNGLIVMAIPLGINAVVVTRVHCTKTGIISSNNYNSNDFYFAYFLF